MPFGGNSGEGLGRGTAKPLFLSPMDAAIQNLDFLRRLISEVRQDVPSMDAVRLRMLQSGMGTGQVEDKQGDR